jgi:hypothetical protein
MHGLMGRLAPVLVGYRFEIKHLLAKEALAGLPWLPSVPSPAVFQLYI